MDALETEAQLWASSGAAALSGWPDGPPAFPSAPLARRLRTLTSKIAALSSIVGERVELDWAEVITVRARMLGLSRQGRISAGGGCRLLQAADGWVALNLARADDRDCLEALLGRPPSTEFWVTVEEVARATPAAAFVEQARLLAMPAAQLRRPPAGIPPWRQHQMWPPRRQAAARLRVVDLSALWAGPLVARVLVSAGAEVLKVESVARPNGARATPGFYSWLHPPGQACVSLDFSSAADRKQLRELVGGADVVIEASRPRALEQLGCDPPRLAPRAGRVWLSITGYGRFGAGREWVAFGDDAAVAGGLVAWDSDGSPVFCADAIADPVAGLTGAAAVLHALAQGGGSLIDLSMADAAAALGQSETWGRPLPFTG
jgi:hypothetical protein